MGMSGRKFTGRTQGTVTQSHFIADKEATLFKREHVARAIAKLYSSGRKNDLLIAKIITKNGKRKVVKYQKSEHRANCSSRRRKRRGAG